MGATQLLDLQDKSNLDRLNSMKNAINKLILLAKEKRNYILVAIPFLLILFFVVFSLFLFQSPSTSKSPTITPPPSNNSDVNGSLINQFVPPNTPLNPTQIQQMKIQAKAEEDDAKIQEEIQKSYPWIDKLPLQNDNYFFFFDVEKKSFIGKLYPKTTDDISVDVQVDSMKNEIMTELTARAIPTTQFPIDWQVTPETPEQSEE